MLTTMLGMGLISYFIQVLVEKSLYIKALRYAQKFSTMRHTNTP